MQGHCLSGPIENYKIMQARLGHDQRHARLGITIKNDNNTSTYYYLNAQDGSDLQKSKIFKTRHGGRQNAGNYHARQATRLWLIKTVIIKAW